MTTLHTQLGMHAVANDNAVARPRRHRRFVLGGIVSFLLGVTLAVAVTGRHVCPPRHEGHDHRAHARVAELVPTPAFPGSRLLSVAPPVSLAIDLQ